MYLCYPALSGPKCSCCWSHSYTKRKFYQPDMSEQTPVGIKASRCEQRKGMKGKQIHLVRWECWWRYRLDHACTLTQHVLRAATGLFAFTRLPSNINKSRMERLEQISNDSPSNLFYRWTDFYPRLELFSPVSGKWPNIFSLPEII